jgi:methylmalonyl-CoA mutase cobalamin-binding domain/chain
MKSCLGVLEPELKKGNRTVKTLGRIVIGTVAGDIHDIGKSIVATMLTASGFEVHDLGVDVSADGFVRNVRESKPDILGLSALLTVTTPRQKDVMHALTRENVRSQVLVVVGGGSVTQTWANEIGADGYASDAVEASQLANKLIQNRARTHGQ